MLRAAAGIRPDNISGFAYVSSSSIDRTSSNSAFTFTGHSIGDANANRVVVVGVGVFGASGIGNISSVTVGGNNALQVASILGSGFNARLYIYAIAVSTGTTADIVVSHGTATTCGIATYRMISVPLTLRPQHTGSTQKSSGSGTSITASVTRWIDSAVVGFVYGVNNGATTFTGLTEDFDIDTRSSENFAGASLYPSTTQTLQSVTATCASSGQCLLLLASWT